jgi:hypothetical protein
MNRYEIWEKFICSRIKERRRPRVKNVTKSFFFYFV